MGLGILFINWLGYLWHHSASRRLGKISGRHSVRRHLKYLLYPNGNIRKEITPEPLLPQISCVG